MKYLKAKISEELQHIDRKIEKSDTLTVECFEEAYPLIKALYYLEKMSEPKNVPANPIPGTMGVSGVR